MREGKTDKRQTHKAQTECEEEDQSDKQKVSLLWDCLLLQGSVSYDFGASAG